MYSGVWYYVLKMSEAGEGVGVSTGLTSKKTVPRSLGEGIKEEIPKELLNELKIFRDWASAVNRHSLDEMKSRWKENLKTARESSKFFDFVSRTESITWMGLTAWERFRETVLLRKPKYETYNPGGIEPLADKMPEYFQNFLHNIGDVWDGYTVSMLTYYGVSMLSSRTKIEIPEKAKLAFSFLVGSAVVVGAESGLLRPGGIENAPDFADIPAGILGATIFAGIMWLNKRFIEDSGKAIKEIEEDIKGSPTQQAVQPAIAQAPAISSQKRE